MTIRSIFQFNYGWIHWVVIAMSALLTFFAWRISTTYVQGKIEAQFEREAAHVIELIEERLIKYEDGLWGGVSAIQAMGGDVSNSQWRNFSASLRIGAKYPGISGIGVIHHLEKAELTDYLLDQRRQRPNFSIHPSHQQADLWPITHIEPTAPNANAVGLDIAHEQNRLTAAMRARDSGEAQITGPIKLVQDAGQTAGFLFFAPFYQGGPKYNVASRQSHFQGMVYAPFIVKKLMEGILRQSGRHVILKIMDGNQLLYSEYPHNSDHSETRTSLAKTIVKSFYGREWTFEVRSSPAFGEANSNNQPLTILITGIIIDLLLLFLFKSLLLSNRNAHEYIAKLTKMNKQAVLSKQVTIQSARLASLGEMAGGISHEIKNPLSIIQGYAMQLQRNIKKLDGENSALNKGTSNILNTVDRIGRIIDGLIRFSRDEETTEVALNNLDSIIETTLGMCRERFKNHRVILSVVGMPSDRKFFCNSVQISQVLLNILNNAFQAVKLSDTKSISIELIVHDSGCRVYVTNSGPKIPLTIEDKIFDPFFTTKPIGEGTGLGLSISLGIMKAHGGNLTLDRQSANTCFVMEFPDQAPDLKLEPRVFSDTITYEA